MTEQEVKEQSLGDILRELNARHEAFLKAVAEDVHARARKEVKQWPH